MQLKLCYNYDLNRILLFHLLVIKTTTNCEQDVYFVINMKLVVKLLGPSTVALGRYNKRGFQHFQIGFL